jgi:hypothetical protein
MATVRSLPARIVPDYDRRRDLPRLLPIWPDEIETRSMEEQLRLVRRLRRALRQERARGLAGHWAYTRIMHPTPDLAA